MSNLNILSSLNFAALGAAEEGEALETKEQIFHRLREARITASMVYRLMTVPSKPETLPSGAITYLDECVSTKLAERDADSYINAAMQWGLDNEVPAAERFAKELKCRIHSYGDDQEVVTYGDYVSCTPDGFCDLGDGLKRGFDTKCPMSKNHMAYLTLSAKDIKKHAPNYYWQCALCAKITGAFSWFLVSYDPRFKNEKHQIKWFELRATLEEIELMSIRLDLGANYIKNKIAELS